MKFKCELEIEFEAESISQAKEKLKEIACITRTINTDLGKVNLKISENERLFSEGDI
jgi:hypothetical protein